jgi:hypothetical protein
VPGECKKLVCCLAICFDEGIFALSAKEKTNVSTLDLLFIASNATNRIMCGIYSWQVVPLSLMCVAVAANMQQ